jgi:hypothetical protein
MISRRAVRILFIGNSLTRAENMLDILVGLAQAGGVNLEVTQHTHLMEQHSRSTQRTRTCTRF